MNYDTTQSTKTDRIRIYVNGTRQTLVASYNGPHGDHYPTEDYVSSNVNINENGVPIIFGALGNGGSYNRFFSGYMAELNYIDGTNYDASNFGETKEGVWIPKAISGLSYGTHGCRLKFQDSSSLGDDTSGEGNDRTASNLVASDQVPDSPTNNFCTLNPLYMSDGTTTEGNLRYDNSAWNEVASTFGFSSGKWYFEVRADAYDSSAQALTVGIREAGKQQISSGSWWHRNLWSNATNGYVYGVNINGTTEYKISGGSEVSIESSAPEITANVVIGIAIDLDSATTSIKYNVDGGTLFTLFEDMEELTYQPAIDGYQAQATVNFGQDSSFSGQETATSNSDANGNGTFHSAVPSGYLALCSANLPELTIGPNSTTQADDHFNVVLYTSDNIGAGGTQSVTGVNFQPDWVWIKNRSSNSTSHTLYDSNRGTGRHLSSDTSGIEVGLNSEYGYLSAFGSDGFTLTGGSTNANYINQSTNNYVAWCWKLNAGTATASASETDNANPAYSQQANATSGLSIITYTGTGANATLPHGLGVAPEMIWVKCRDNSSSSDHWYVYSKYNATSNPEQYEIYLNLNIPAYIDSSDNTRAWNATAPTSSVFSIGDIADVNQDGKSYIAYCFASVEGYSKMGTIEGNASTDGAVVYTGFRPRYVFIKNIDQTGYEWAVIDSERTPTNEMVGYLVINEDVDEDANYNKIDFLSNGFKIRSAANNDINHASTAIYYAVAEQPFKYANAK